MSSSGVLHAARGEGLEFKDFEPSLHDAMSGDGISSASSSFSSDTLSLPCSAKRKKAFEEEEDEEVQFEEFGGSNFSPKLAPIVASRTLKLSRLSEIPCNRSDRYPATAESSFTSKIDDKDDNSCSEQDLCSTPKSKECIIPVPASCPPAPKKPRPPARNKQVVPNFFVNPEDLEQIFRRRVSEPKKLLASCSELARLW